MPLHGKFMIKEGLTFDDVLLTPRKSRVFSRKDVTTKTQLSTNIYLNIPLVSANMDTVTESKMARSMAEAGGIGIIHRFLSIEKQTEEVRKVKRAESIVIEEPITAGPTDTLRDVNKKMKREGISSVLVVNQKNNKKFLVGILTSRDLLFEENENKKVESVMTINVVTASKNVSPVKAKAIQPFVENLITIAKKEDKVHAIREIERLLQHKNCSKKIFEELVERYKDKNSGYTKTVNLGPRAGDNAPMVQLQLI